MCVCVRVQALTEIEECCDSSAEERLHLTMVASAMPCLAWVSVPMNPSSYISDMINSIPGELLLLCVCEDVPLIHDQCSIS